MAGLVTKRERQSLYSTTQDVYDNATASSQSKIPLGWPIKVGLMPILRGKGLFGFLSSIVPVFLPGFNVPSFLNFSSLSCGIVLQGETIYLFSCNILRGFSISEDSVIAFFPYSPTKMWNNPCTESLGIQTTVVASPLEEEVLDVGRVAPAKTEIPGQKIPHF